MQLFTFFDMRVNTTRHLRTTDGCILSIPCLTATNLKHRLLDVIASSFSHYLFKTHPPPIPEVFTNRQYSIRNSEKTESTKCTSAHTCDMGVVEKSDS